MLIFLYGEFGWNIGIPLFHPVTLNPTGKNVTLRNFRAHDTMVHEDLRAHYTMVHEDHDSALHYAGRLLQQWLVDQYAKVELSRLNYFRTHQKLIRADLYRGLVDSIANGDSYIAGCSIILPSSFTAGPRYMAQCYQDAMAIVREYGKPDLFITFTCNPSWDEISEHLLPNQQAFDRPA